MAYAENTVEISKPISLVFKFISQGENNKLWRDSVLEIERTSKISDGVGAYYRQVLKGPMNNIPGDYEITKYEVNKLIEFQVQNGPARPIGKFEFTANGDSTKVKFSLSLVPKGFMGKIMDKMIQKTMTSELNSLKKLKEYLESH